MSNTDETPAIIDLSDGTEVQCEGYTILENQWLRVWWYDELGNEVVEKYPPGKVERLHEGTL
jgi:hypothetical protein